MNNKINLDDLLKEEMGNLSPEPPANLWQNISSQLPDVATTSSTTTAAAKTVVGVSVKSAVIAVATIAVGAVGYVMYTTSKNAQSNNKDNSSIAISETVPESETEEQIQDVEEAVATEQSAEFTKKSKSTSNTKTTNTQSISKVDGVTPDVETPIDYPAPTSTQNNNDEVQKEETTALNIEQQRDQTTTEKTQPENKQIPGNSSTSNTTNEEFLKPNIPNVFTPNNDGYNDEYVITIENEVLYDLKITDAKGHVVFESKDKNKHWNATNQKTGEHCEPGVYVMAFRYQLNGMKEPKVEKGLILLKL